MCVCVGGVLRQYLGGKDGSLGNGTCCQTWGWVESVVRELALASMCTMTLTTPPKKVNVTRQSPNWPWIQDLNLPSAVVRDMVHHAKHTTVFVLLFRYKILFCSQSCLRTQWSSASASKCSDYKCESPFSVLPLILHPWNTNPLCSDPLVSLEKVWRWDSKKTHNSYRH